MDYPGWRGLLLRFSCFRCGICCRSYQARLSLGEAKRIAGELGITWNEFHERYLDHRWPGTESFLLRHRRGACLFLKREQRNMFSCLIHSFRPSSCQEWMSGLERPECQEGLARYWRLEVAANGELKGDQRKLQRFQAFLESLGSRKY